MKRLLCVLCALCGSLAAPLSGHELGTTRISVVFQEDRTYLISIVTDASALADKLQSVSGQAATPEADPVRLQTLLSTFDGAFRRRIKVAFDGVALAPGAITYAVAAPIDASS